MRVDRNMQQKMIRFVLACPQVGGGGSIVFGCPAWPCCAGTPNYDSIAHLLDTTRSVLTGSGKSYTRKPCGDSRFVARITLIPPVPGAFGAC